MMDRGPVLTTTAAEAVVGLLRTGESFTYYRGHLAKDRVPDPMATASIMARCRAVSELADLMMRHGCPPHWTMGDGTVVDGFDSGAVTQRRVGNGSWEYRFTKR